MQKEKKPSLASTIHANRYNKKQQIPIAKYDCSVLHMIKHYLTNFRFPPFPCVIIIIFFLRWNFRLCILSCLGRADWAPRINSYSRFYGVLLVLESFLGFFFLFNGIDTAAAKGWRINQRQRKSRNTAFRPRKLCRTIHHPSWGGALSRTAWHRPQWSRRIHTSPENLPHRRYQVNRGIRRRSCWVELVAKVYVLR